MAFMRHNNNGRRHNNNYNNNRHRSNNSGQSQNGQQQRRHVNRINQVFESNGPEGRVRGTAAQIVEKYTTMARDASVSGDKVLSMNYSQHAEHYQRLLNEITEENAIFERDREAQRAAQQTQPDVSAGDAAEGFADMPGMDEQPREQREPRQPREDRQDRSDRPERQERAERPERQERPERRFDNRPPRQERAPRPQEDDSDLNTLPGFLQVPITEAAPPPVVVETAAKEVKPRTPRPRRVVSVAPSEE